MIALASGKTSRRSIPFPLKTDPDTITADMGELAKALDNDAETGNVKKHSELPAAKTRGRQWQVTEDTEALNGIYWDTGTEWIPINTAIKPRQIAAGNTLVPGTLSWGGVSTAGAVNISGSGDFTSEKTGTGAYLIKWTAEKSTGSYAVLAIVRTIEGAELVSSTYTTKIGTSKASFSVKIYNTWDMEKEPVNGSFSFICVAP